jgi:carotenoid cleavage dioxygenase-like enzyme
VPVKVVPGAVVARGGAWIRVPGGDLHAYEIGPELETIGRFDFGGGLPLGMCAHPRIDPRTRELVVFRYDVSEPYLTWAVVGPDGSVVRPPAAVPGIGKAFMIHDFTITEHHALFVIGPAILDVDAMLTGGSMLNWRPDLGTKIALVPRAGDGPVSFAELEPFWVWHFANAYEDGDRVVADFPSWSELSMAAGDRRPASGQHGRVSGASSPGHHRPCPQRSHRDPRRRPAQRVPAHRRPAHRPAPSVFDREHSVRPARPGQSEHDRLLRWDMATGHSQAWDTDASIGEVVFVPRDCAAEELDGYYMTLARSVPSDRSWLYIWDAADFPRPPVAKVALPAPVPNGLHANWFSRRR